MKTIFFLVLAVEKTPKKWNKNRNWDSLIRWGGEKTLQNNSLAHARVWRGFET
jgi:hypothetical protein